MRMLPPNGWTARKSATVRGRGACTLATLIALVLVSGCGSSRHPAYTQSGVYDSGLKARAAGFVAALNAKNTHQLEDLVFPEQKNELPAFVAAYGGRGAVVADFPPNPIGPDTEGTADIQITCSSSQTIVLPQVFSWKKGNWRTYIYLPGQKGVPDQQCT